jgi:hypothetical protein
MRSRFNREREQESAALALADCISVQVWCHKRRSNQWYPSMQFFTVSFLCWARILYKTVFWTTSYSSVAHPIFYEYIIEMLEVSYIRSRWQEGVVHDNVSRRAAPPPNPRWRSLPLVVSLRCKPRQHWDIALTILTVATGDGRGGQICPTGYVICDVTADVSDSRNE